MPKALNHSPPDEADKSADFFAASPKKRGFFHIFCGAKPLKRAHLRLARTLRFGRTKTIAPLLRANNFGGKKMLVKIYWLMWLLGVLAVGLLYLTGLFTPTVAVIFGFISFGAIFMGIIGVLPISVSHPPAKH